MHLKNWRSNKTKSREVHLTSRPQGSPVVTDFEIVKVDIEDPAEFRGTQEETDLKFSEVRDLIHRYINLLKGEV